MITRLISILLLLPAAAFAAAALLPIEFNGVVVEGSKIQVSLLNPNTGSAKWVTIGGKFDNYIVTSCNVLGTTPSGLPIQNPTVVLTNATTGTPIPILIKSSQILSTPAPGQVFNNGQPGMVTTTVTMGPNGPVVNVGPGGPGGPAGGPGGPPPGNPGPQPAPTTAPAPPAPGG
jgi:hypothetical protein